MTGEVRDTGEECAVICFKTADVQLSVRTAADPEASELQTNAAPAQQILRQTLRRAMTHSDRILLMLGTTPKRTSTQLPHKRAI